MSKKSIRASEIGEFIRYKSCPRRFKLAFNKRELAMSLPFAGKLFATLDPVLQISGQKREADWERYLLRQGLKDLSPYEPRASNGQSLNWQDFRELVSGLKKNEPAFLRELELSAEIASFKINGSVDFILLLWKNGFPILRLVECKASRKDQTYHRVQLAVYFLLLKEILAMDEAQDLQFENFSFGISGINLEAVLARIDESNNKSQTILDLNPLDLTLLENDLHNLLSEHGQLAQILDSDLESLDYQLEAKCDDCLFNIHCFPESSRLRKLQLLGLPPSTCRALARHGMRSIDDLANCDLESKPAALIKEDAEIAESLEFLKVKAGARRVGLPPPSGKSTEGAEDVLLNLPVKFDDAVRDPAANSSVRFLSYRIFSQLPEHEIHGQDLIRAYLSVSYDYVENRIAAISAHVCAGKKFIFTKWQEGEGKNLAVPEPLERWLSEPDSKVIERVASAAGSETVCKDAEEKQSWQESPLSAIEIVEIQEKAWTGVYEWDNRSEKEMLEKFFLGLVDALKSAAGSRKHAPLHFYFWSKAELARLIESCTRTSSALLGHFQELLGCRESLEQPIYSCLSSEIYNRYALAWTGRGLNVCSSVNWYGWTFHWNRLVDSEPVWLNQAFYQDLFDFKYELAYENGRWLDEAEKDKGKKHIFELRSQFEDNLPTGYLYAYWGKLDELKESGKNKKAIERFRAAEKPGMLKAYLNARAEALRWLEERIIFKSSAIVKPPVFLESLPDFSLNVENPARAAIDFLRLEFHIRFTDWLAEHLIAPAERIIQGKTVPLRNIKLKDELIKADINCDAPGMAGVNWSMRFGFSEGDFVRLSPCQEDAWQAQSFAQLGKGGITCVIESIDWQAKTISLTALSLRSADRYRLASNLFGQGRGESLGLESAGRKIFEFATVDENPSDYVAGRVEDRLLSKHGRHAIGFFDRSKPGILPLEPAGDLELHAIKKLLMDFELAENLHLAPDQLKAVLDGLSSRVQLLHGPPGTGKTMTSAVATLSRILCRYKKRAIIMISANTHTAINTLLARIAELQAGFLRTCKKHDKTFPLLKIFRLGLQNEKNPGVQEINADESGWQALVRARADNVVLVAGTCSALLKMAKLSSEFKADFLLVDEASMLVYPFFLALATLCHENASFMLAGDHRQLSPILAHDWDNEDRPPAVLFQPHQSAFESVLAIGEHCSRSQFCLSALDYTFRLPPQIRKLISMVYRKDEVELKGMEQFASARKLELAGQVQMQGRDLEPVRRREREQTKDELLRSLWLDEGGLFLIVHDEKESRKVNPLEVEFIELLIDSAPALEKSSLAVVTPHRAQRALLQSRLARHGEAADLIDTVERLQGGERPNIIFSGTVSDPASISANVEFVLDLNRSNVAFSRAKERLFVICSREILDFIPSSLEAYEEALLWKYLRHSCRKQIFSMHLGSHSLSVYKPG